MSVKKLAYKNANKNVLSQNTKMPSKMAAKYFIFQKFVRLVFFFQKWSTRKKLVVKSPNTVSQKKDQ